MKKRYQLNAGFDISVTVDVDLEKLTPALAKEINDFWSEAEDVLEEAGGDIILAAVLRAGSTLIRAVLGCFSVEGAQEELDSSEGWPPNGEHGITLVDYEAPDLADLEVTELPV